MKGKTNEVWQRFPVWENVICNRIVEEEWDVIYWFNTPYWDNIHQNMTTIKNRDEVWSIYLRW